MEKEIQNKKQENAKKGERKISRRSSSIQIERNNGIWM